MPKSMSLSGFSLADLRAPGGVERLLGAHRSVFGDAVMEGEENPPSGGGDGGKGFTPPSSQEEFDRVIQDRVARERKKYEDYDALKVKAEKFDQSEEAKKTEGEKRDEELKKATEAREAAQRENAVLKASVKHRLSDEDAAELAELLDGVPADKLVDRAEKLASRFGSVAARKPGVVPTAGTGNQSKSVSSMEAGRERALAQLEKNK